MPPIRFAFALLVLPAVCFGEFQTLGQALICGTRTPLGVGPRATPIAIGPFMVDKDCGGANHSQVSVIGYTRAVAGIPNAREVFASVVSNGVANAPEVTAYWRGFVKLKAPDPQHPPVIAYFAHTYELKVSGPPEAAYAYVLMTVSSKGGISQRFEKDQDGSGNKTGVFQATLNLTSCPCVFEVELMAHVSTLPYQGKDGPLMASAKDPFTVEAPPGWTYTVEEQEPTDATGLRFVPVTPCRVMETRAAYNFEGRTGAFGPPSINAGETRTLNLPVSNVCSIPSTAKAYVVNVTASPPNSLGFVTLWPAGELRPDVWTIRSPDGQTVANSAIVKAGASGGISVYASDKTDLLIDISGYYTDSTAIPGLAYYPLTPCRVIETRSAYRSPAGPFGPPSMNARQTRKFTVPSTPYCTVPRAAAYSVTITAVPPGPLAYLTAWPDGGAQPNVSSINSFAGRVLANSVIVPAASDGSIDVYAYDATDFIVDINGYYAPDDGQGLFYFPVTQCRANDSTVSGGIYADDTARTINIPASTECTGIPATAKGYAINVTALPNGNPMPFLTAWPTGSSRPNASILNAFQGQTVTNSAIIPAGTNGAIDIYANRRTNVVVEVSGYFGR